MTTPDGDPAVRQPFWAHAEIDGTALDVVPTLVHALATRWVTDDLADQFRYSVAVAAATVVMGGGAAFDLWEEPGRLTCHIARNGAPDATVPQPDPRRLRLVTPATGPGRPEPGPGIVIERSPGRVTLSLAVPFE